MPLPKGIYIDPELRQRWIMERQSILDRFDVLRDEGVSASKAAREVGQSYASIEAMRESVERLSEPERTGRVASERIDLGLALLSVANPGNDPDRPRERLTTREIAAWCGCTHSAIERIEQSAIRKMRRRLNALLREQVIHGDFGDGAEALLARPLHPLAAAA